MEIRINGMEYEMQLRLMACLSVLAMAVLDERIEELLSGCPFMEQQQQQTKNITPPREQKTQQAD